MRRFRDSLIIAGPLAALLVYALLLWSGQTAEVSITAGVTVLCVLWWIFEPVPIPVTSLVPFGVLQVTGVLSPGEVAQAYGSPIILLLLGGLILSKAMERSGAHRRIALGMINLFGGTSSKQLVMGFMATAAVLSMWISNTATTLMLLPVAMAVIEKAEDPKLAVPLMLGVAYAASIGGIGTPIGTPPNLVFMQVYSEETGHTVTFVEWMRWGIPIVICMIPVAGFWLTRSLTYRGGFHLPDVGTWTTAEKRVMWVFALTALAWITRQEPFGGWSALAGLPANDASVALVAVIAMFMIPDGKGERLLNWETASSIPWGVLLLFSGGMCLAKGFMVSGLSSVLGESLTALAGLPLLVMILTLCLGVTFMTEMTSNTASTVLLMPILAAAAIAADIDPRLLMVPAAISASCAFMLPVATAPNSIVYSSGAVSTERMAREGLAINILGAFVISLLCYSLL